MRFGDFGPVPSELSDPPPYSFAESLSILGPGPHPFRPSPVVGYSDFDRGAVGLERRVEVWVW